MKKEGNGNLEGLQPALFQMKRANHPMKLTIKKQRTKIAKIGLAESTVGFLLLVDIDGAAR